MAYFAHTYLVARLELIRTNYKEFVFVLFGNYAVFQQVNVKVSACACAVYQVLLIVQNQKLRLRIRMALWWCSMLVKMMKYLYR